MINNVGGGGKKETFIGFIITNITSNTTVGPTDSSITLQQCFVQCLMWYYMPFIGLSSGMFSGQRELFGVLLKGCPYTIWWRLWGKRYLLATFLGNRCQEFNNSDDEKNAFPGCAVCRVRVEWKVSFFVVRLSWGYRRITNIHSLLSKRAEVSTSSIMKRTPFFRTICM